MIQRAMSRQGHGTSQIDFAFRAAVIKRKVNPASPVLLDDLNRPGFRGGQLV